MCISLQRLSLRHYNEPSKWVRSHTKVNVLLQVMPEHTDPKKMKDREQPLTE